MKRVLVTGATGFVGRHTLGALIDCDYEVHALGSRAWTVRDDVTWHAANLLAIGEPEILMQRVRPSHLLHLAWYAEPGRFWSSPVNVRWVEASLALLRAFREAGGRRLVMAGTCAEYDWTSGVCLEATTPTRPRTLYGACKAALHDVTMAYAANEGLSAAWGRLFFLYGPGEHPERLVSSVTRSLLRSEPALCSHGQQVRDFLHVADVAEALCALLDSPVEGAVNIASGAPTTVKAVIDTIATEIQACTWVRLGARPSPRDDPPMLVGDPSRLRHEVKWSPRFSLQAGIADTVDWWRRAL